MASVWNSEVARADIKVMVFGQIVENTLYFILTGGWSEAGLTDLASALIAWWIAHMRDQTSSDATLMGVTATSMASETAPSVDVSAPADTTGNADFPAQPGNVTFTTQFRTTGRGRSSRGRNYAMGVPSNVVTGDTVSLTWASALAAAYAALNADLDSIGCQHVVYSRVADGVARAVGLAQLVTAYGFADLNLDSQRRRLAGRGT
jgi:hypothetical protein